jgi:hypothetical protein
VPTHITALSLSSHCAAAAAAATTAAAAAVDLPKKHGRGGQSALRFARLRMEKRHNYVRKVSRPQVQGPGFSRQAFAMYALNVQ